MKPVVNVWTDGSSLGNPGPSGRAALVKRGSDSYWLTSGEPLSTNNAQELKALIMAAYSIKTSECTVAFHTDSINAIGWLYGWNRRAKCPDKAKKFETRTPHIAELVKEFERVVAHAGYEICFVRDEGSSELVECDKRARQEASMQLEQASRRAADQSAFVKEATNDRI